MYNVLLIFENLFNIKMYCVFFCFVFEICFLDMICIGNEIKDFNMCMEIDKCVR